MSWWERWKSYTCYDQVHIEGVTPSELNGEINHSMTTTADDI